MTKKTKKNDKTINASPTKSFFVEMLTRDIELEDAILDLLDNCIDGIQRSQNIQTSSNKPYEDFQAKISFSSDHFIIEDNCGGISEEIADKYAFRMGRPEAVEDQDFGAYTIGTYGIGMKRAIFKMGQSAEIISQTETDAFIINIEPEWLTSDENWDLPFSKNNQQRELENGTTVRVTNLRPEVAKIFSTSEDSSLHNTLFGKIALHYSFIINKGFTILINNQKVDLIPLNLLWEGSDSIPENPKKEVMAPYLYKGERDGVEIRLAVGFYRQTASPEEVEEETQGHRRRSGDTAGWTIICNDRVVLYGDKTRLTGWGVNSVPSYHPQFIGISGIVEFRSTDARKLPITTTKRGIDSSSDLYLYIKDLMSEGMKLFTSYTNKWKKNIREERTISSRATSEQITTILDELPDSKWKDVRGGKVAIKVPQQ
jgi:Histidine kinase-, DNA gyrase B-, and HSP90-like ATPase